MKKPSVIAGLVVFASLLALGFFARLAYRHYQERRSLEQAKSPALETYLATVQMDSVTNAAELYGIALWMADHGFAEEATRALNKLFALLASCNATDFEAQNNLAATSLLLKVDLSRANELAREVYLKHGDQPIVASTYAFSLFLQGRTREALAAFARFKTADLESPPIALYYGVFLSANGETNKAVKYFEIARGTAAAFLPAERALMAKAADPLFQ